MRRCHWTDQGTSGQRTTPSAHRWPAQNRYAPRPSAYRGNAYGLGSRAPGSTAASVRAASVPRAARFSRRAGRWRPCRCRDSADRALRRARIRCVRAAGSPRRPRAFGPPPARRSDRSPSDIPRKMPDGPTTSPPRQGVPLDMNRAANGVHLHGLAGNIPRSARPLTRKATLSGPVLPSIGYESSVAASRPEAVCRGTAASGVPILESGGGRFNSRCILPGTEHSGPAAARRSPARRDMAPPSFFRKPISIDRNDFGRTPYGPHPMGRSPSPARVMRADAPGDGR